MATVTFTDNLKRHLECPSRQIQANTLKEALHQVFLENPRLGDYILDDQDRLRKHMAIFVDGQLIRDPVRLSDPLTAKSRVHVMQALSGG